MSATAWEALVRPHFGYLEHRYGMRLAARDDTTNWETTVTYTRQGIAVIVRHTIEFDRAEVELVRLVDGKFPDYPIFIHPDTPINYSLLDNLLELRSPADLDALIKLGGLERPALERSLAFQAKALEKYAAGFLAGDASIFGELDHLIKRRVARDPQRVTLWFPAGTAPNEIDRAIADTERVDARVPVDIRFYKRPLGPRKGH